MSIMVFVNYAGTDKDERLWNALKVNLAPDGRSTDNKIQLWDAHKNIIPGQNRKEEIRKHLQQARIFLFLLSPDYFANPECVQQMQQALERKQQEQDHVHIIPILLRPSVWQGAGLDNLQILPRNKVAISRSTDHDEALVEVTEEIYAIVNDIDNKESIDNSEASKTPSSVPPQQSTTINAKAEINNPDGARTTDETRASSTPAPASGAMDVAIVIALEEEFKDLFADIEANYTPIHDVDANAFYYSFERNSAVMDRPYRCVTTFVGDMGEVPAALLAQNALVRWKPATMVLIGLAGALDSGVRLGDVVVADQVDAYLQNAKVSPTADKQGYTFEQSGDVYRTSSRIWNAAQNFEQASPLIFRAWQQRTEEAQLSLFTKQQRYKLLGDDKINEQPHIIKGHIASGPVVVAAEIFAKWLKERDRKYKAIEMESMGLMAAVYRQPIQRDTLILRAISDDGKEDKSALDNIGGGAIRRYAMRNAIQLLWSFLDAGILPQNP